MEIRTPPRFIKEMVLPYLDLPKNILDLAWKMKLSVHELGGHVILVRNEFMFRIYPLRSVNIFFIFLASRDKVFPKLKNFMFFWKVIAGNPTV